jgi:pyruvate dehydrogenase E1 component alpha subunit
VESWLARDPLDLARARLVELGLGEDDLAAKDTEIDAQMDRAVENALAAPYPDPEQDGGTEFKG